MLAVRTSRITLDEYNAFLRSWEGTPYQDCGDSRAGIDCLRFVVKVLDWLHGWDGACLPAIPKKPKQTSLHDFRTAFSVVQFVRARYPHQVVWHRKIELNEIALWPGDCIVVRNQVYPGHGLVAGATPNSCWHALNDPSLPTNGNVHETNLGWCIQTGIVQIFRPTQALLQC